jgi:hypothetical protein
MVGQKLDYACLLYPICGSEIQNFETKMSKGMVTVNPTNNLKFF